MKQYPQSFTTRSNRDAISQIHNYDSYTNIAMQQRSHKTDESKNQTSSISTITITITANSINTTVATNTT